MKPINRKDEEQEVNGVAPENDGLLVQKRIALRAYELYLQEKSQKKRVRSCNHTQAPLQSLRMARPLRLEFPGAKQRGRESFLSSPSIR